MEEKTKWWKLKKEECSEGIRERLRQALGCSEELPDDWVTTATGIWETVREVSCLSSGQRTDDKETWW